MKTTAKHEEFSAVIAICGLLFAANPATADHGDGTLAVDVFGGSITVTAVGGDVPTSGIEFQSAVGNLIPAFDASPFTFLLSNTSTRILFANLGSTVTFPQGQPVELSAGYKGFFGDLTGSWGHEGGQIVPFSGIGCPLTFNSVIASPVSGSTLDFGLVSRSDVSAFRLTDAIKITLDCIGQPSSLTHFEITGALVFDVPDFKPVIFWDGTVRQSDVEFDLVLDVGAPPGRYEAELSIFGDFLDKITFDEVPITYSLTAQIVPEPGDFNLDGVVDLLDINLLGLKVSEGSNDASFDLSSDQLVNQDDLNLFLRGRFITGGNKLNGDADFDGTVAFADFLNLSSNFGQDGKKWSEGDFIANGRVEFDDFLTLSANFGKSATVAAVPEAASLTMAMLAFVSLLCRRRNSRLVGKK